MIMFILIRPIISSNAKTGQLRTVDLEDASSLCFGEGCVSIGENDFTQQDSEAFLRSDSLLTYGNSDGFPQEAQLISELQQTTDGRHGEAFAFYDIAALFSLENSASISISFFADVFMSAYSDWSRLCDAQTSMYVKVVGIDPSDDNWLYFFNIANHSQDDFYWAPDGSLDQTDEWGDIWNGTETADPFDLNPDQMFSLLPGTSIYDPTNDGIGGNGGIFSATTDTLQAETLYGLQFRVWTHAQQQGVDVDGVPEPSTMLLLGVSLVGLVGAKRKLKK